MSVYFIENEQTNEKTYLCLQREQAASLPGFKKKKIPIEADRQHPEAGTQAERLNPIKCIPCVGLSYNSRVQNMTENVCFISPLYS